MMVQQRSFFYTSTKMYICAVLLKTSSKLYLPVVFNMFYVHHDCLLQVPNMVGVITSLLRFYLFKKYSQKAAALPM